MNLSDVANFSQIIAAVVNGDAAVDVPTMRNVEVRGYKRLEDHTALAELRTPIVNRKEFATVVRYATMAARQNAEESGDCDIQFCEACALPSAALPT